MKLDLWQHQPEKKMKRGFRGDPAGAVAFHGPDDRRATRVVAAIIAREGAEPDPPRKWFAESLDVRADRRIGAEVAEFPRTNGTKSIVVTRGIFGCPREEGIDYPDGEVSPQSPAGPTRTGSRRCRAAASCPAAGPSGRDGDATRTFDEPRAGGVSSALVHGDPIPIG